jgi:hypothetical protein
MEDRIPTGLDVNEIPFNKRHRRNSGYNELVLIDAGKFKALWESQHPGEKFDWNPSRLKRLELLESVDDYPKIYAYDTDRIDVLDGRHRITTAANRGVPIWCATKPGTQWPEGLCLQTKKGAGLTQDQDWMGQPGDVTKNPAFQAWFNGSKVVDDHGRPLRVYHGTNQSFDTFNTERGGGSTQNNAARMGFWFAAHPTVASEYADLASKQVVHNVEEHEKKYNQLSKEIEKAERRRDWETLERLTLELENHEFSALREEPKGMNVMPVFLRITNPKVIEANGSFLNIKDAEGNWIPVGDLIKSARDKGHDGVVFKDVEDTPGDSHTICDHFVVFSPSQIKSAIGNAGTFNPKDNRVTASSPRADEYKWTRMGDEYLVNLNHDNYSPSLIKPLDQKTAAKAISADWYHGSPHKFDQFKTVSKAGVTKEVVEQPIFLTPDLGFAKLHAGAHGWVYKVRANVESTFDGVDLLNYSERYYLDPKTFTPLGKKVYEDIANNKIWLDGDDDPVGYIKALARRNWDATQCPEFVRWMKANGYDSFLEEGEGHTNLGVFDSGRLEIISSTPVDKATTASKTAAYTAIMDKTASVQSKRLAVRRRMDVRHRAGIKKQALTIGPVYHGTTYDFDDFKRNKGLRSGFLGMTLEVDVFAFFFTKSKQQAIAYAKNRQQHTKQPCRLITANLTINNLLDLTNPNWVNTSITTPPIPLHKIQKTDTAEDSPGIYEEHAEELNKSTGLLDYLVNYLLADEMTSTEWGELAIDDGRDNYDRKIREPQLEEGFRAYDLFDNKKVTDALHYLGFDGAKVPEGDDQEFGGESYCVLSSNQVKIISNVDIDRKKAASTKTVRAYHGTTKQFDTFEVPAMFHVRRKYCEDLIAGQPDGHIIEAILTINNPANLDTLHVSPSDPKFKELAKSLEEQGYDGAQYKNEAWIAFYPDQIRVVNGKLPTFTVRLRSTMDKDSPQYSWEGEAKNEAAARREAKKYYEGIYAGDKEVNDDAVLNQAVKAGKYPELAGEGWPQDIPSTEALKRLGYDGIVYNNEGEGGGDSYVNFYPEQVEVVYGKTAAFRTIEARELRKGDIVYGYGQAFVVQRAVQDGDEMAVMSRKGQFRRFELTDQIKVDRNIGYHGVRSVYAGVDPEVSQWFRTMVELKKQFHEDSLGEAREAEKQAIAELGDKATPEMVAQRVYTLLGGHGVLNGNHLLLDPEEETSNEADIQQFGKTKDQMRRDAEFQDWARDKGIEIPPFPKAGSVKTAQVYDVYHGTEEELEAFNDKFKGTGYGEAPINMLGFNFTDSEKAARTFGERVVHARVRINRPYIIDLKGEEYSYGKHTINRRLEKLDKDKYDGIIIKNYADAGRHGHYIKSNHYVPFSTSQIQIVDPAEKTAASNKLYHGTSMYGIVGILNDNTLYEGVHWGRDGEPHGPRLSRSKTVASNFAIEGLSGHPSEGAIIEFDAKALAQDYKLQDYEDVDWAGEKWEKPEHEVVVVAPEIKNVRKYITAIYLKVFKTQKAVKDYSLLVEEEERMSAKEWLAGYAKLLKDPLVKTPFKFAAVDDNSKFQAWFNGSKVVDAQGKPLVMYHGTSKDIDFPAFRNNKNGIWFTDSPDSASSYADNNDSQGYVYEHGKYEKTNTRSRVMPCYLSIKNPYKFTPEEDEAFRKVENYKRFQAQMFDKLRAKGYDGIDWGHGIWVVIGSPNQVKSAIGNNGEFSSKQNITASTTFLYHGTSSALLKGIFKNGDAGVLNAPNYWGTQRIAESFADAACDENGGTPIVFKFPLSQFDQSSLEVDHHIIAEPDCFTLNKTSDALYEEWEKVPGDGTWQDCLRIYEAVVYKKPVPVTKDDFDTVWSSHRAGFKVGVSGEGGATRYYIELSEPDKTAAYTGHYAFYIEVPKEARDHFWDEPPAHKMEFWAFRSRPRVLKGERIIFTMDKKPVAESLCAFVEKPGESKCGITGKYEKHWKVYWEPKTFKKKSKVASAVPHDDPAPKTAADYDDAYQQDRKEYSGKGWHENETDDERRQRYRRGNEWDQSLLAAISLGQFDPKEADNRNYIANSIGGRMADGFKPLPQTLYHVTTAKSKVQSGNLMSRFELDMGSGLGLGGGDDKSISFTEDLDIAKGIYNAMIEAKRVAAGEFTIQQMLDLATKGAGADRPWLTEFIRWAGAYRAPNNWNPGEPYPDDLQALLEGKKIQHAGFVSPKSESQLKAEGLEPVGDGWQGRDEHYWSAFKRPMTAKEKQDIDFDQYKLFCATREHAGGALNPLFFASDAEGLAKVPESEIAILQFKPIPGAMGTQESALGEWRTYSGKAVQLVGDVTSQVKTASTNEYILYHGTDKPFSRVDMNKGAQNTFWLTSDLNALKNGERGATSVKVILRCKVKITNPAGWDEYDKYSIDELIGLGYDGIILPDSDENFDAVVFEPSQVKIIGEEKTAAWHGTPHQHDEFNAEYIGTGEGANAYGWGFYFAENKEVAKQYSGEEGVGGSPVPTFYEIKGVRTEAGTAEQKAADLIMSMGTAGAKRLANEMLTEAKREDEWTKDKGLDYYQKIYDLTHSLSKADVKRAKGLLMEAQIPEADVLLDWDNEQQPPKVAQALAGLTGTGKEIYHRLSEEKGSSKAASLYLLSLGVKGIKYLDAYSRNQGKGTSNFVIFDAKDIRTVGKKLASGSVEVSPDGKYKEFTLTLKQGEAARQTSDGKNLWHQPHRPFGNRKNALLKQATDPNRPGFLFPEMEPDLQGDWHPEGQPEPEVVMNEQTLEDRLNSVEGDKAAVERTLNEFEAWKAHAYPGGALYCTEDAVIDVSDDGAVMFYDDPQEFVNTCRIEDFYPDAEDEFNKEFWSFPQELYHATDDSNLYAIMKEGLNVSNKTRGMSNRWVGSALFTSENIEQLEYGSYGDAIIAIDMAAMKAAGGELPYVGREPDVQEGESRESLAHALDLQNYSYDYESGMDAQTIIVYGSVPPQFLHIEQGNVDTPRTASLTKKSEQFGEEYNKTAADLWHGGRLYGPIEIQAPSKGRYEAGPGLYLTTSYARATQYAKGGKATYLVSVKDNLTFADKVEIPLAEGVEFATRYLGKGKLIATDLKNHCERMKKDTFSADILINLTVNYEAGSGKKGLALLRFLVDHGVDAALEAPSFGHEGKEQWVVVFNPKVVTKVRQISAKEVTPEMRHMPRIASDNKTTAKTAALPEVDTKEWTALLNRLKRKIVGTKKNVKQVATVLGNALGMWGVWIDPTEEENTGGRGEVFVSGCADSEGDNITLYYNEANLAQLVNADDAGWTKFVQESCIILAHELTHLDQFKANKRKNKGEVIPRREKKQVQKGEEFEKYFGSPIEISAFARDAVEELRNHNFSDVEVLKLIKEGGEKPSQFSSAYRDYWTCFGLYTDTPVANKVWKGFLNAIYQVVSRYPVKLPNSKKKKASKLTILYLDDCRVPNDPNIDVVHNYNEFVAYFNSHEMPNVISFDHDIDIEHCPTRAQAQQRDDGWRVPYEDYTVPTGLECAKWLVEHNMPVRGWQVHSANPVGADNIRKVMKAKWPKGEVYFPIPHRNDEDAVYGGKVKNGFRVNDPKTASWETHIPRDVIPTYLTSAKTSAKFVEKMENFRTTFENSLLKSSAKLAGEEFDLDDYLSKVTYENDIYDAHDNETYGTVRCKGPNGQTVGYIDYSLYTDYEIHTESGEPAEVIHIKMIETHRDARHRGIATKMLQKLKADNLGSLINWGGLTPEGNGFRQKFEKNSAAKGDCFKDCFSAISTGQAPGMKQSLSSMEDVRLVHGLVNLNDGRRGDHAWIEFRADQWEFVWEPQSKIVLSKDDFYNTLKPEVLAAYPEAQALGHGVRSGHSGPWEKVAAPRSIWYHGTPYKNLRSILAQGLIPEVKKREWQDDEHANIYKPSRESYGGVYVTTNMSTAMGAPRDTGYYGPGRMLLIAMELQPNTMYMDEDDINLTNLANGCPHLSDASWHVPSYYIAMTSPNTPEYWKEALEDIKARYIKECISYWDYNFENSVGAMHPEMKKRFLELLPSTWEAAITRQAAHAVAKMKDYDVIRAYRDVFSDVAYDETPPKEQIFPTIAQGEAAWRKASDQLTRSLKSKTRITPDKYKFRDTARITTPIGYHGSNRIIAVAEIRNGHQWRKKKEDGKEDYQSPVDIVMHYGKLPEDFFNQWKERQGTEINLIPAKPRLKSSSRACKAMVH